MSYAAAFGCLLCSIPPVIIGAVAASTGGYNLQQDKSLAWSVIYKYV